MQIKIKITTHLLEWPTKQNLTTPNADENVEQPEFSNIAGGNEIGPANLENSLAVYYPIKHTLTIWSSYPIPGYLERWTFMLTQISVHK